MEPLTDTLTTVVLWLFVINLGIAFGAGVFESRIVVPQWFTTTPDGRIGGTPRPRVRPRWAFGSGCTSPRSRSRC